MNAPKQANIEIVNLPSRPRYSMTPGEFLVLGRSSAADIVLSGDTAISRLHCKILYDKKEYWVEDLGSRNRTYVNGAKIERRALASGDRIQLGRHTLHFTLTKPVAPPILPEQENFFLLKREDKLTGKILVMLGFLSREILGKCVAKQEELARDGPYYPLEEILLQEGQITREQFEAIEKYKKDIPFVVPDYQLCELVAIGGMGRIYRGKSLKTGEWVAVKIFSQAVQFPGEQLEQQFRKEAAILLKLRHPNIVSGIEFGESNCIYLVMEYISGPTLQQYVKDRGGRLLPDESLDIVIQIARALEHAHGHAIVHRDIKPENVLLTPDRVVKLCDFGLVKSTDRQEQSDKEERVFGTVAYMSPEQIRGERNIDIRSDIYSLGAMFYRMVFGRIPFVGNSHEIRSQHLNQPLLFPSEGKTYQKTELARIIQKMMAKDPKSRYQSPTELSVELSASREQFDAEEISSTAELPHVKDPSSITSAIAWRAKSRKRLWAVVAAVAAVILAIFWSYWAKERPCRAYRDIVALSENGRYTSAREGAEAFLSDYPESEFVPAVKRELQKCLLRQARYAREDRRLSEARSLCEKALLIPGESEIERKCRELLAEIKKQEEPTKPPEIDGAADFEESLENIEKCLSSGDLAGAEEEFARISKKSADPRYVALRQNYQHQKDVRNSLEEIDALLSKEDWQRAQTALADLETRELKEAQRRQWSERRDRLHHALEREALRVYHYYPASELESLPQPEPQQTRSPVKIETMLLEQTSSQEYSGAFLIPAAGCLYCLSAADGKLLWAYPGAGEPEWLFFRDWDPVADSAQANCVLLFVRASRLLTMISITSGETIWKTNLPAALAGAPLSLGQDLFVPCRDRYTYRISVLRGQLLGGFLLPESAGHLALDKSSPVLYASAGGYIYAFDLTSGALQRRIPYQGSILACPAVIDSGLIVVSGQDDRICIRHRSSTGMRDFWIEKRPQEIVLDQNGMIAGTEEGGIVLLWHKLSEASPLSDHWKIKGKFHTARLVENGKALILAGDKIRLYRLNSSKAAWEYPANGVLPGLPYRPWQKTGPIYLLSTTDGQGHWATAIDAEKRRLQWQKRLGLRFVSYALNEERKIWLAADNGAVYRVDISKNTAQNRLLRAGQAQNVATCLVNHPKSQKILALRDKGASWSFDYNGAGNVWKIAEPLDDIRGATLRNETLLIVSHGPYVKALTLPGSAKVCHFRRPEGNDFTTAPVYADKSVYLGNLDGNCYRLDLSRPDADKEKWVLLKKWAYATGQPVYGTPAVLDKRVFFGSDSGDFHCLGINGDLQWLFPSGKAIRSCPLPKKNLIYCGNDDGDLYALTIVSGEVSWQQKLSGAIRATPVYRKGKLYAVTVTGDLAAFDAKNGKKLWATQLGGNVGQVFFACGKTLCAATDNGFFYMIRPK